jgi:hypothetical protein
MSLLTGRTSNITLLSIISGIALTYLVTTKVGIIGLVLLVFTVLSLCLHLYGYHTKFKALDRDAGGIFTKVKRFSEDLADENIQLKKDLRLSEAKLKDLEARLDVSRELLLEEKKLSSVFTNDITVTDITGIDFDDD